jgi:hypothetical protein
MVGIVGEDDLDAPPDATGDHPKVGRALLPTQVLSRRRPVQAATFCRGRKTW